MSQVRGRLRAARKIERAYLQYLLRQRTDEWITATHRAAANADIPTLHRLLQCQHPFQRLLPAYYTVQDLQRNTITFNALVNLRDKAYGTTFLHSAAKRGSVEAVELLLQYGASVDVVDAIGETPLHCTCNLGDSALECSKLLLQYSIEQARDKARRMHVTQEEADQEAVWILSEFASSTNGTTVLDSALQSAEARHETVYWLVEQGAYASVDMQGTEMNG